MIYGSNQMGEGILTMGTEEHAKFQAGEPVVKITGCAKGMYKITVKMERIGDMLDYTGGEKKARVVRVVKQKKK